MKCAAASVGMALCYANAGHLLQPIVLQPQTAGTVLLCCCLCCENRSGSHAGKQDSAKPPKSSLALGDARINPFITSYRTEYAAPFASGARIRSPLRNKMLADVADLKEIYSSAFQRVGE